MKKTDKTCVGDCHSTVEAFIQNGRRGRKIRTLGGRSKVTFGSDSGGMYCITSGGNTLRISVEMIRLVCDRYSSLKRKNRSHSRGTALHLATGKYNSEDWPECPHLRTSPYVAAVVALVNGEHPFEKQ
jgi:hypothetical protein